MVAASRTSFRWSSTSIGVTFAFILAIIIPFLAIVSFTYFSTRPALIDAANQSLQSDAQTRVQLIDNYLNERVLDTQTLAQVSSVQTFVAEPPQPTLSYKDDATHAAYSLVAGTFRDKNYTTWTLLNKKGGVLLSYPTNVQPTRRGDGYITNDEMQQVMDGQTVVSPVYFDPASKEATVDLYSPIAAPSADPRTPGPVDGAIRATLNLNYIWQKVLQPDAGNNGTGSSAFMLDSDGVYVSSTNTSDLFTSVMQLDPAAQLNITQIQRFGSANPPTLRGDSDYASVVNNHQSSATFQTHNGDTQVAVQATKNNYVRWYYFVLSPVSTVTSVANHELWSTVILAVIEALIVGIIALFARQSLVRPILNAVERLRQNTTRLNSLALEQQQTSEEQMLVIDSSQGKLQSVQYYTDATKTALQRLNTLVPQLSGNWMQYDARTMEQLVQQLYAIINYLENASEYQDVSNRKLADVLNVATMATEALHSGSVSATEAAEQNSTIVMQLLSIIGKAN